MIIWRAQFGRYQQDTGPLLRQLRTIRRCDCGHPGALCPPRRAEVLAQPRLVQRRERRRDHEHVLLADELAARRWRPGAGLLRLGAGAETLARALIRPDMDPPV